MNRNFKKGFTLIELVLVVGIVAIISVIAIGKFTDFRKSASTRMASRAPSRRPLPKRRRRSKIR